MCVWGRGSCYVALLGTHDRSYLLARHSGSLNHSTLGTIQCPLSYTEFEPVLPHMKGNGRNENLENI